MARGTVVLRDEQGSDHGAEVSDDGSVSVGGRVLTVLRIHAGEMFSGQRTVWTAASGDLVWTFVGGRVYTFEVQRAGSRVKPRPRQHESLSAPMPATVLQIKVSPGDRVRAGSTLIVLEAMKMELPIRAAADGVVTAVRCREGELVPPGRDLIEMTPEQPPATEPRKGPEEL